MSGKVLFVLMGVLLVNSNSINHLRHSCHFLSGSQTRLPAPSPLRTVRASFPAYSSSLFQGIFDTRFHNLFPGILMISMAIGMVQLNIARHA